MSSEERPTTLITGGSRGIGAAIARRLARDGHDLALTYRERRSEAETVAEDCRARGARVLLLEADLGDLAPLVITRAAIEVFVAGGGGAIVNISSGAASTGAPHTYIPYAMSKAALNLLTVGTAKEFARQGVRVNTVSPGTTYTEIHAAAGRPNAPEERAPGLPMGRAAQPEEIAGAVAYLLSEDASYTNGAEIRITGG